MAETKTITVEDMRAKLLTLDEAKKRLGKTEPLFQRTFPLQGKKADVAHFALGTWNVLPGDKTIEQVAGTDEVAAQVTIGGEDFALTKDALLEATSFVGITKQYAMRTPTRFIEPELNFHFANGGAAHGQKTYKALVQKNRVIGFAKETIVPFSNLALLGVIEEGIQEKVGESDVLVDYKFHHDLRRTAVRLIIPGIEHEVRPGDAWSMGMQLKNSAVGEQKTPLALTRYFFRWVCTNGQLTTTQESQSVFNRRIHGQDDDEVLTWAREAVDGLLSKYDGEFRKLDHFAKSRMPKGVDANHALLDVFETYRVPLDQRSQIIDELEQSQDYTMYGIMNAITRVANDSRLPDTIRETLMNVGGDLPEAHSHRCSNCHRLSV